MFLLVVMHILATLYFFSLFTRNVQKRLAAVSI